MSELGRELDQRARIKIVVKWLIGNGIAENQEDVGKLLGYSNKSSFSQILNGKVPVPTNFINKIVKLDDRLNESWISEGWGQMTNESINTKNNPDMYDEQISKDQKIAELKEELERYKAIVDRLTGRVDVENKQTGS